LLTHATPVPVVYGVLLVAGMTRSMNFTGDEHAGVRGCAQRAAGERHHAVGHDAAGRERTGRGSRGSGRFPSFRRFARTPRLCRPTSGMRFSVPPRWMAGVVLASLRLPADAGAELARRSRGSS
jgi:hypothetical protein